MKEPSHTVSDLPQYYDLHAKGCQPRRWCPNCRLPSDGPSDQSSFIVFAAGKKIDNEPTVAECDFKAQRLVIKREDFPTMGYYGYQCVESV